MEVVDLKNTDTAVEKNFRNILSLSRDNISPLRLLFIPFLGMIVG